MPEIKQIGYDLLITTAKNPNAGSSSVGDFQTGDFDDTDFQTAPSIIDPQNSEIASLIVQPQSYSPNTVQSIVNLGADHMYVNNKFTNSGELSMILKNALRDIDYYIDEQGNLIVSGEDAKNYDIDDAGNLIYLTR